MTVNSDYVGDGYGLANTAKVEVVKLVAQYEGILRDPVYSGKGFAGLIDLIREEYFKKGEIVVFLHIALKAAGIQPGDAVLTNAFTLAPVPGAINNAGCPSLRVKIDKNYPLTPGVEDMVVIGDIIGEVAREFIS